MIICAQHGRRIIYLKLWDPSKINHDDILCILYLMILLLAREPKTQIAGISIIADQHGLSYSHLPSWRMLFSYQVLIKVIKEQAHPKRKTHNCKFFAREGLLCSSTTRITSARRASSSTR